MINVRLVAKSCILASIYLGSLAGCSEAWRPSIEGSEKVECRLLLRSQPVRGGWVEFVPVEGALGFIRSSRIRNDGTFSLSRVARGKNVIRVVVPTFSPNVEPVFQSYQSPIRPIVENDPFLEIDLSRPSTWSGTARDTQG